MRHKMPATIEMLTPPNRTDPRSDLPAVGVLLNDPDLQEVTKRESHVVLAQAVRNVVASARQMNPITRPKSGWAQAVRTEVDRLTSASLQKVINATGVILHTNLGRAPIDRELFEEMADLVSGYVNLEFDLEKGERGSRYVHCVEAFRLATGCEDALVVNNNAAAVMLALRALARDREAIVSRGELVEIGGSFRLPEIMESSGAHLKEVGTTNRTRLSDYEKAIGRKTALLLKVHPSNYRIEGFVEEVALPDLVKLGKKRSLPVMIDLGSGTLEDLRDVCGALPRVSEVVKTGVDLLAFSGDKLLGGPQAGILLGKKAVLNRLRNDPWLRIVRTDKLTLALLERVVRAISTPGWKSRVGFLVERSCEELRRQANVIVQRLKAAPNSFSMEVVDSEAAVGGGTSPEEAIPSVAISIRASKDLLGRLDGRLRSGRPPVIGRRQRESLLFDLRTVFPEDAETFAKACRTAMDTVQKEVV
ncbi:MAG TPA: L-seryl-tRNA(Sec) selenium transferase [Bdellovibrionota bacterium]|nr:L-seryl-tRNA(Sec) selenium transferase [Bdellovibrionota bacterium]